MMKVTLDLDDLLDKGRISAEEHEKLRDLAAASTGSLAFNILIGFGVIAVSAAALALVPLPSTAIALGFLVLLAGLLLLRTGNAQWTVLSNICVLVGALLAGGGILLVAEGSLLSILSVTGLFALASVLARSSLLAVLATLMLSACLGARTGYFHASYFLVIQEPALTIVVFSALAMGLYKAFGRFAPEYQRLAIACSRTSVFLVNFGFWVGSLWGEHSPDQGLVIADSVFALAWALALVVTGVWAWSRNRRWLVNTVAVFAGIHFYTQWFEHLGASPGVVLLAGLLALGFAVALRRLNFRMQLRI